MAAPLQEAYRSTTIPLEHIVPLNFESTNHLPESHVWTPLDDLSIAMPVKDNSESLSLPVIDLMAPNVTKLILDASEKWGTFFVTNQGVSPDLLKEFESQVERLFALPMEEKLKTLRPSNGATGYGMARISPYFEKLMWHEGFTIMGSSAIEHAKELWPHDYQEFCYAMDKYKKKLKALAYKILIITLKALGANEEQEAVITSCVRESPEITLQLNSYPCCPNPDQAIGLVPHTDTSIMTILHQNDTIGLQVQIEGIGWVVVPPVPGALLVNHGDFMSIISNGCIPSQLHRVKPNNIKNRTSMAFFYNPSMDVAVGPLPNLQPPRFRSISLREYVSLKMKYLYKALSELIIT